MASRAYAESDRESPQEKRPTSRRGNWRSSGRDWRRFDWRLRLVAEEGRRPLEVARRPLRSEVARRLDANEVGLVREEARDEKTRSSRGHERTRRRTPRETCKKANERERERKPRHAVNVAQGVPLI